MSKLKGVRHGRAKAAARSARSARSSLVSARASGDAATDVRIKAGPVMLAAGIRGTGKLPVFFVHGLTANRLCFQHIENALHEALGPRITTITYDLRGRGLSDKPEGSYGPRTHAEDLQSLLAAPRMKKHAKAGPLIVAHSLGAYAALEFAAMYPGRLRGLVLLDGGGSLTRLEALRVYVLLRLSFVRLGRRFPDEDAYLDLVRKSPLVKHWTPELEAMLRYDMVHDEGGWGLNLPVHVIESELRTAGASLSLLRTIRGGRHGFMPADTARVRCPVLLVRATKRNLVPGDSVLPRRAQLELAARLVDCRCVEIPANHYSILLEPQPRLNSMLQDFAARLGTRSG